MLCVASLDTFSGVRLVLCKFLFNCCGQLDSSIEMQAKLCINPRKPSFTVKLQLSFRLQACKLSLEIKVLWTKSGAFLATVSYWTTCVPIVLLEICRPCVLGYTKLLHNGSVGAVATKSTVFGQGSGPVLMSNLYCNGMESTILACDQYLNMYGVLSCQDAGVICEGRWLTKIACLDLFL